MHIIYDRHWNNSSIHYVTLFLLLQWEEDQTWRMLRLVPKPNGPQNLITFRHGRIPFEGRVWPDLTTELEGFIENYSPDLVHQRKNITECYPGSEGPPEGLVCLFDIRSIDPHCLKDNSFGYQEGSPCVFLQFNNITNWRPEQYSTRDLETIEDLPSDLRFVQRPSLVYLECKGKAAGYG